MLKTEACEYFSLGFPTSFYFAGFHLCKFSSLSPTQTIPGRNTCFICIIKMVPLATGILHEDL
jgi:hypothetical protein